MEIRVLDKNDLEKIKDVLSKYKYDKFIKSSLFNTSKAREYLFDKIKEFYLNNPNTTIIAKNNNEILGLICYKKVDWDTKHFGFNSARIDYFLTKDLSYKEEINIKRDLLKNFEDWCKKEEVKFVNIKIDSNDYPSVHALNEFGFKYMATILTPILDCRNIKDSNYSLKLRNCKDNEISIIADMAADIFRINRFHLDDNLDKKKSDELHSEWVRNRYKENPESVYVLEKNNEIIGFYIVTIEDLFKYFGLKISYLDLAGVSKKHIGKGYDLPLFYGMLDILKNKVDIVYTDFIVENTPIFNVYVKLGFRFIDSKLSLHKWF